MNEVKRIDFSANVNALGRGSGFGGQIPIEEFPLGKAVCLSDRFPSQYEAAMKPIWLTRTDTELVIESAYKSGSIPLEPWKKFSINDIGLSYATCDLDIYVQ